MSRDDIIWSKIQVVISRAVSLTDLEKVALGCQIREAILDGIKMWEAHHDGRKASDPDDRPFLLTQATRSILG